MSIEKIEIEVDLEMDVWKDTQDPRVVVKVDEIVLFDDVLKEDKVIKESIEIEEDTHHSLSVKFYNKQLDDTVVNSDGEIEQDLMLTIKNIKFDGIDLGMIPYNKGILYPNQSNPYAPRGAVKNITNIGWNGVWEMHFSSPTYIWLLENM